MPRLLVQQCAATVFAGTALALIGLHPIYHHIEGGALDSCLQYVYLASLDAMRQR